MQFRRIRLVMAKAFVSIGGVKIHKLFASAVLATGLLLDPGPASALTIIETTPGSGIAQQILDLDVGGTPYNVVFLADETANNLYGGIYDFDNATDASAAVDATNDALNDAGITAVGPNATDSEAEFRIGFMSLGPDVRTQFSINNPPWTNDGPSLVGGTFRAMYADFTVVPEPSTAALTALGLIGLAARRRRR